MRSQSVQSRDWQDAAAVELEKQSRRCGAEGVVRCEDGWQFVSGLWLTMVVYLSQTWVRVQAFCTALRSTSGAAAGHGSGATAEPCVEVVVAGLAGGDNPPGRQGRYFVGKPDRLNYNRPSRLNRPNRSRRGR